MTKNQHYGHIIIIHQLSGCLTEDYRLINFLCSVSQDVTPVVLYEELGRTRC